MIEWTHFVHKFKNATVAFLILYEGRFKDVLLKKGGTLLIHCEITGDKPYMFTICVDYNNFHSTF
jgi:hypothetical protein